MKDKIIYTKGCTYDNLDINQSSASEISVEEKRRICHKLIDQLDNEEDLEQLLRDAAQEYGDFTYERCDECGDSICTYSLTI